MALDLGIAGLASGFDWRSLVEQLADVERAPEQRIRNEQGLLLQRNTAYGNILSQLATLKTKMDALKDPSLFSSRRTSVADSDVLTASASTSAALGVHTFDITQLATASSFQGSGNVGRQLNATNDVSALVLSNASFGTAITAGTFTVNGSQVTIATTDTLQQAFDKISAATSGAVAGGYDSASDKITLTSAAPIVLGSASDTSNFLTAAKLHNNGTNSIASAISLGVIRPGSTLATANFATAVSDGGSGAGQFKVNGVSISFNATTDTVSSVLSRINNSAAGVSATYDNVNDRLVLTNKTTGDLGVALQDVTGNFLAATGLSGGTLTRGKNLLYTVDGGAQLTNQSNAITEADSGLAGITVQALAAGSTTVTVSSDTAKVRTAITDVIAEYNKTQTLINTQTASTTDAKGKVTAGILAGESDANTISSKLRSGVISVISGLSGSIAQLAALGIDSNGNDDTISLKDSAKLDAALADNLAGVQDLFSNSTSGLAVKLSAYLDATAGESGFLVSKQGNLTRQSAALDTHVVDLERLVLRRRQQMIDSFVAMEKAQAGISQQLQFLKQRFGIS